jgi:hypothetical protein
MNILFGFLLISLSFMVGMPVQEGHSKFGQVKNPKLLITNVLPNSPAYKGGVKSGDIVLFAENGNKTIQDSTAEKVTEFIRNSTGEISLLLKNGNNIPRLVNVLPSQEIISGQKAIGVSLGMVDEEKFSKMYLDKTISINEIAKEFKITNRSDKTHQQCK